MDHHPYTDEQLVGFAIEKSKGQVFDLPDGFREFDLNSTQPMDLFQESALEGRVYVFTTSKDKDGKRKSRRVGKGVWSSRGNSTTTNILNAQEQIIGCKSEFIYFANHQVKRLTTADNYLMVEYSASSPRNVESAEDYVVCKIEKYQTRLKKMKNNNEKKLETLNSGDRNIYMIDDSEYRFVLEPPGPYAWLENTKINPENPFDLRGYSNHGSFVGPEVHMSNISQTQSSTDENQEPTIPPHISSILPQPDRQIINGKVITFKPPPYSYYEPILMIPTPPSASLFSKSPVPSKYSQTEPALTPPPSKDVQAEPALTPRLYDDDRDPDWLARFTKDLKKFQTHPSENIDLEEEKVEMLSNPKALWYLEDMIPKKNKK